MGRSEVSAGLRLGRRRLPSLSVPGELFELYQPLIGSEAVMAWLNLRWLIHTGEDMSDIESVLVYRFGMTHQGISTALQRLIEFELLEPDQDNGYIVHEPLSADAFFHRFGDGQLLVDQPALPNLDTVQAATPTPAPAPTVQKQSQSKSVEEQEAALETPLPELAYVQTPASEAPMPRTSGTDAAESEAKADLQAVVEIYHKRIGMLGPTQFEKLRFWVEEQGMEAEVVALAIEETVASAENPRINYLEGILRNWYNSGIRTLTDLMANEYASKVLHPRPERRSEKSSGHEGAPNATAYQAVSPDIVDRWKELYPDEYDE